MKSIKQQYIDLKEGRMSQANFMRNLRMTMPQFVTNVTSFNDSVKILRNKGILSEADLRLNENTAAEELAKEMGNYDSAVVALQDEMGLSPREADAIASKIYGEDDEEAIMAAIKKYEDEESGRYTTGGEQFEINEEVTDPAYLLRDPYTLAKAVAEEHFEELTPLFNARKAPGGYKKFEGAAFQKAGEVATEAGMKPKAISYLISFDEDWAMDYISALYKELESGKYGAEELMEAKTKWENTSGKAMYDQFREMDNLNGHELMQGIDWEMEKNHELSKEEATKIAIKNIKKNSLYYTMADLAGKEGAEAEYMGGKSADPEAHQMILVKGENFVDKKRGMKSVKDVEKPKKDSDTATAQKYKTSGISLMSLVAKTVRGVKKMDATGEKMKKIKLSEVQFNGFGNPNAATEAAMQFIDSNPTLKAISNELTIQNSHDDAILQYRYWDTLPKEAIAKLEMQFDVEEMYDFDEDTGTITAYRLTLKGSPYKFPGLGQSAEDRLAEEISKYIKETFDGRDNLTDVTGENQ